MTFTPTRIDRCFADLRASKRKALIAYLVAGDPHLQATVPAMHQLVASGVSLIELGVPFSDPEAEGPVIQRGHERALSHGTTLSRVLQLVAEFRRQDAVTPVILMGYLNPIERMGYERFTNDAANAGVDGVLLVNMPPEEALELRAALAHRRLQMIFLLAPTTTLARARQIAAVGSGFLYFVSLKGITGASHLAVDKVAGTLAQLRPLTDLPIVVGFGIKDAAAARAVAAECDGVVVGSAIVAVMASHVDDDARAAALADLVGGFRRALDA